MAKIYPRGRFYPRKNTPEVALTPYEKAQAHRSPGNGINQFDLCCRTGFSRKKCAYYPPFGTHVFLDIEIYTTSQL